jgi:hypothetical protein
VTVAAETTGLTTGPFTLALGTTVAPAPNDPANGAASVVVQVQNTSAFVVSIVSGGDTWTVQAFTAATIPATGQPLQITPTQGPATGVTTANTLTLVWLLADQSPPIPDGPLTSQIGAPGVGLPLEAGAGLVNIGTQAYTALAVGSTAFLNFGSVPADISAVLLVNQPAAGSGRLLAQVLANLSGSNTGVLGLSQVLEANPSPPISTLSNPSAAIFPWPSGAGAGARSLGVFAVNIGGGAATGSIAVYGLTMPTAPSIPTPRWDGRPVPIGSRWKTLAVSASGSTTFLASPGAGLRIALASLSVTSGSAAAIQSILVQGTINGSVSTLADVWAQTAVTAIAAPPAVALPPLGLYLDINTGITVLLSGAFTNAATVNASYDIMA